MTAEAGSNSKKGVFLQTLISCFGIISRSIMREPQREKRSIASTTFNFANLRLFATGLSSIDATAQASLANGPDTPLDRTGRDLPGLPLPSRSPQGHRDSAADEVRGVLSPAPCRHNRITMCGGRDAHRYRHFLRFLTSIKRPVRGDSGSSHLALRRTCPSRTGIGLPCLPCGTIGRWRDAKRDRPNSDLNMQQLADAKRQNAKY